MSLAASTRSETTKVFSTAAWWVIAIVMIVYVGGMAAGMAGLFGALSDGQLGPEAGMIPSEGLPAMVYSIASSIGYVFPLLIGTLMVTAEFRHQTLTPTFLATPRRGIALSGKVVVAALLGLLFGVMAIVVTVAPGAGLLAVFGIETQLGEGDTWAMLARILIAFMLWTVIGVGLGALVRNQVAAIVIVLAFTQFVEPILRIAGGFLDWLNNITSFLPGAASDTLVGTSFFTAAGGVDVGSIGVGLDWWGGGLVLAGYAVVLLVLGGLTSWRRDIT